MSKLLPLIFVFALAVPSYSATQDVRDADAENSLWNMIPIVTGISNNMAGMANNLADLRNQTVTNATALNNMDMNLCKLGATNDLLQQMLTTMQNPKDVNGNPPDTDAGDSSYRPSADNGSSGMVGGPGSFGDQRITPNSPGLLSKADMGKSMLSNMNNAGAAVPSPMQFHVDGWNSVPAISCAIPWRFDQSTPSGQAMWLAQQIIRTLFVLTVCIVFTLRVVELLRTF